MIRLKAININEEKKLIRCRQQIFYERPLIFTLEILINAVQNNIGTLFSNIDKFKYRGGLRTQFNVLYSDISPHE